LIPLGQKDEVPEILERIKRGESIHHYETARKRKDGQVMTSGRAGGLKTMNRSKRIVNTLPT
jgi:hypothetical protein